MDLEAQADELVVLSSIYEDCFHEAEGEGSKGGELVISLDLPGTISLISSNGNHGYNEPVQIQHLPRVYLHFCYPPNYPSEAPPSFTLTCKWITKAQLSLLCCELDKLWEENKGSVIIYTWSQFIHDEATKLLELGSSLDVDSITPKKNDLMRQSSQPISVSSSGAESSLNSNEFSRPLGRKSESVTEDLLPSKIIQNVPNCDIRNISDINRKDDVINGGCAEKIISVSGVNVIEKFCSGVVDNRAVQDIAPNTNLFLLLREYDQDKRKKEFNLKSFKCAVCFTEKIGKMCLEFWPCSHVYCKDCMRGYFEVQIREGNVKALQCPTEKCSSEANPKQVEELVSAELYERWDSLLLSSTLSALGDTQPCPRQHCQYPVTLNGDQGTCPVCSFVFCSLCRFGTHGKEPCKLKNSETKRVLEEYSKGDDATKARLEERYGRKYLQKLQQELLSMNYISNNAKRCPKCSANIEKMDGCNKMVCQRCHVTFCWLCMKILEAARPYDHYNGTSSDCYNKLFEGVDIDDFPDFDDVDDDHEPPPIRPNDENLDDDEEPGMYYVFL
ncbi:hypothetical protein HAZT_HAZT005410 [Hyalella azteca]|uniref:RBR-type E3 ubiquitin transferase n=1 Tax=Hyalella azteca TaxID=294128 RepID=A0A6A0H738_HYAAZ|nr:E3 ubiquitin-protein ligase RNF14 isoform X2 [Hyalella azteca]KAA0201522.1 hypothetical protein HAZT_HAZT005410 [Hyalella azteca]